MAEVRNSFYDGESDLTIATTEVTSEQLAIDTSVAEAEAYATSASASATSASTSASSAQASQDAVEDIIPTGGTTDQILMKNSDTDNDLKWENTINSASMNGGYF